MNSGRSMQVHGMTDDAKEMAITRGRAQQRGAVAAPDVLRVLCCGRMGQSNVQRRVFRLKQHPMTNVAFAIEAGLKS